MTLAFLILGVIVFAITNELAWLFIIGILGPLLFNTLRDRNLDNLKEFAGGVISIAVVFIAFIAFAFGTMFIWKHNVWTSIIIFTVVVAVDMATGSNENRREPFSTRAWHAIRVGGIAIAIFLAVGTFFEHLSESSSRDDIEYEYDQRGVHRTW